MLRLVLSVVCSAFITASYAQLKKFYSLRETSSYDTVVFSLNATSGNCFIESKSPDDQGPLTIYGNPDLNRINPSFKAKVTNNTCNVTLDLEEFTSAGFGDGLVFAMVRSNPDENNYWKIHLDENKIYKMDLEYGFGNADVDLSNIPVRNFKIRSGTADVVLDYSGQKPNPIEMDTFLIKVDMGSIEAQRLQLAGARHIIANIGFGRALLDFSGGNHHRCQVNASVGAGNLDINLPKGDVPVIIYVKDSPLCGMKLLKGYEEVEKNVYVNMNYKVDAENLLTFHIDVALGHVSFHQSQ